jgi:hypothetical protein
MSLCFVLVCDWLEKNLREPQITNKGGGHLQAGGGAEEGGGVGLQKKFQKKRIFFGKKN